MKRIIILQGPNGTRKVEAGIPYKKLPGETVVGSARDDTEAQLYDEAQKEGIQLGDLVKQAIDLIPESVRPKHCSRCEKKKLALNRIRELGVKETVRQLIAIHREKDATES